MDAFELRPYQRKAVDELNDIMKRYNVGYLAGEVRTGKTFMALTVAKELGWSRVCFITKKLAITSIKKDLYDSGYKFLLFDVVNFEQAPNLYPVYDGYIVDEATSISAFPKPGKYCKLIKTLIHAKKSPCILMSGTPTAESPSQIFHQFWVSPYSPFGGYGHRSGEFYGWAKEYVNIKQKRVNGFFINDYSRGNEAKIKEVTKHYMVSVSQQDAGFTSFVEEEIFWVDIDKRLYQLMNVLKKNKVYQMKKTGDTIVADTPVKMQILFHQISSGTVITGEEPNRKYHVLDESKAQFIKKEFFGKKIAIFYSFISEGEILRRTFPLHTDNPEIFNNSDNLVFICQMVSGRMGVNLSSCDWLIMYNIAFSATTYWQIRARMQTQTRTKASKLAWIFSKSGIEKHVLKAVGKKKDFTLDYFIRAISDKTFLE